MLATEYRAPTIIEADHIVAILCNLEITIGCYIKIVNMFFSIEHRRIGLMVKALLAVYVCFYFFGLLTIFIDPLFMSLGI